MSSILSEETKQWRSTAAVDDQKRRDNQATPAVNTERPSPRKSLADKARENYTMTDSEYTGASPELQSRIANSVASFFKNAGNQLTSMPALKRDFTANDGLDYQNKIAAGNTTPADRKSVV